jgi:pyrroline-5-carboxylate reductase
MTAIAFIGGGNMASALIGGLRRSESKAELIVVEPDAGQRDRLAEAFGVIALVAADDTLQRADLVVWAVKPQYFADAAKPCAAWVAGALQLSVMAGIRSDAIVSATGAQRVVRAMPNTPALIGAGIAGLFARDAVDADGRARVEALLAPTGALVWVEKESDLDAVTALSGSGPAYVFYFIEAMIQAAVEMGLSPDQGRALALATFAGATELARRSSEPLALLRDRVTSKGGTTFAALTAMQAAGIGPAFVEALRAAQRRAAELGDEFGGR